MEKEFIEMARRCSSEITGLKAQIERLTPKAEAYDNMAAILGLMPKPSRGYGEDLAWKLDRRVEELLKAQAKPAEAETP